MAAMVAAVAACDAAARAAPGPADPADPVAPLRQLESALRASDVAARPPPERASGADPVDVAPFGDRLIGVLAGDDAVVLLDDRGQETARAGGPSGARTLAVAGDRAYVAGASPVVFRYRRDGGELVADGTVRFPDVAIGALAVHPGEPAHGRLAGHRTARTADAARGGALYAAGAVDGVVRAAIGGDLVDVATCRGASRGVATAGAVAFACVLDHAALVVPVDRSGRPRGAPVRIRHDGPVWTVALAADTDGVLVALGGAEDHPLDRSGGFFGYIDSFAFLYRVAAGRAVHLGAVNLGEHGVAVPKWITVRRDGDAALVDTAGYASDALLSIRVALDARTPPAIARRTIVPGTHRLARIGDRRVIANPLLDAWVLVDADRFEIVPIAARRAIEPAPRVRLGELLFFTTLMAPWATSEGAHSRFTCETCHWEGYGDGRVHYTGRGDVHASTRSLRGLVQGRPYFSRANDRTMVDMVHAEFGVAARGTDHTSWFVADSAVAPWLSHVPGAAASASPLELRAAFMEFLAAFGHEANPAVAGRTRFSDLERRGAERFRDRCEGCHQARFVVDDETTRVAFADWERRVMSPQGAITWASSQRLRTGVTPYVHPDGARVPGLRRLYRKHPYFTNGRATSLSDVLERARTGATVADFRHDGAGGAPLPSAERAELIAFLRLL